jgi:hypothetical protein
MHNPEPGFAKSGEVTGRSHVRAAIMASGLCLSMMAWAKEDPLTANAICSAGACHCGKVGQ